MSRWLEHDLTIREKEKTGPGSKKKWRPFILPLFLMWRLLSYKWDLLRSRYYFRRSDRLKGMILARGKPSVENSGYLEIGRGVRICSTAFRSRIAVKKGGRLVIGDNCRINGAIIAATDEVLIGNNCRLAPFSHIMDGDFHDVTDRQEQGKSAPVIIQDDVWICTRSIVLKGVTIGRGAVVASGAVVTRDVPAYTLVGGVPATVLRRLPPGERGEEVDF